MRTASFFYVRNELPVSPWVLLYIHFKQDLRQLRNWCWEAPGPGDTKDRLRFNWCTLLCQSHGRDNFLYSGLSIWARGGQLQRGLHYRWQVPMHQMPVSEVLILLPLSNTYTLRCCSKCASTCFQCPLKLKLGADQVVARGGRISRWSPPVTGVGHWT